MSGPSQRVPVPAPDAAGSSTGVPPAEKAAQALLETEERYRQLVDSLPVAVAVHVEGRVAFANPEALRTLRAPSLEVVIGRPILDFVHADYRGMVMQRVADAYQRKVDSPLTRERFVRLDGEVFDVEVLVRAVPFAGRPAGQVVFWDVTERLRAEETLRDSEERYRHLLEGLPDGVIVDCDERVAFANDSAARLLGVDDPADLVGRPAAELVHREDRPGAVERARRVVDSGEPAPLAVARLLRRDGAAIVVEAVGLPIRHRGRPAVQLVFRDVTARKRAETERNWLFDLSIDMFCVADLDIRFKELNPAWTATLGWELEELKKKRWLDFVHPDDVAATIEASDRLRRGENVMLFMNRCRAKDGSYRRLSWNAVSIPEEGLIFAVVRDITERLRLEEQLRQAEKMTALGQLAGGVAHDFNNQLAGILGYAELLRERVGSNETLRRYAEGIATGAQRSARLTQQLLAFARKGKYQVVPVDLNGIVDEVLAILEHSIDKRIVIRRVLSATPIQVGGDPAQLQNALLNLAINARDAMPVGGELTLTTETVTVDHAFLQADNLEPAAGRFGCVRIRDTGVGMDEETQRRAFEPFFTTKEPGRGTGLGLSAAYGIVRNHLGALRLTSAPGQGTTAEVFLPLAPPAADAKRGEAARSEASFLRILLVDDEDLVRSATEEMLTALGHTVRACRDGREAVEVFTASPDSYDLVVLDMIMPHMSGADALARMRAVKPRLRAILSSGYSLDAEAQRLLGQGSLSLIQKPFTVSALADAIASAEKSEG